MYTVHAPFRLASIPEPRNRRFPELGADTLAVLAEHGYTASEIEQLVSSGAVQAAVTDADPGGDP
jgi:crotonobetainyl-CoA:carnitine CoA-transferase CaiB-like acyl-CoA transferase